MYDLISIFTENNILLHVNQKLSQNRILTAFFDIFYTASDQTTLKFITIEFCSNVKPQNGQLCKQFTKKMIQMWFWNKLVEYIFIYSTQRYEGFHFSLYFFRQI